MPTPLYPGTPPADGTPANSDHWNAIVANVNSVLGLSLGTLSHGTLIHGSDYQNLVAQVNSACASQGRSSPFAGYDASHFNAGQIINNDWMGFQIGDIPAPPQQTIGVTDSGYTYTVPLGVNQIRFNWVIGAGASGGAGNQQGNGGGGGGGGSGAYLQNQLINVSTGDVLSFNIGVGGPQNGGGVLQPGQDGGATAVYLNGNQIFVVEGGHAGTGANGAVIVGNGGGGGSGGGSGSPGFVAGQAGATGSSGTGDTSSGTGGQGGSSPFGAGGDGGGATGGDAYSGASAGKAGNGYGAGGGGGGFKDRSSPYTWSGGAGIQGYVEFVTPA